MGGVLSIETELLALIRNSPPCESDPSLKHRIAHQCSVSGRREGLNVVNPPLTVEAFVIFEYTVPLKTNEQL